MFRPAVTLDAALPLRTALARLEIHPPDADVIVRRVDDDLTVYWYRLVAADVRGAAERLGPAALEQPLKVVLDLHESGACETFQAEPSTADELSRRWGVLLDGDVAIGVIEPSPPPATANGGTRGGGGSFDLPNPFPGLPRAPGGSEPTGPSQPGETLEPFTAFPDLQAPRRVEPRAAFDLTIRLAAEAPAEMIGAAITVTLAQAVTEFALDVQVIAPDFGMPEGGRRELRVVRDDPSRHLVDVRLVAPDIPGAVRPYFLEVQFAFGGEPVGRAWREVIVAQPGAAVPDKPVAGGATAVATTGSGAPPDLTVTISASQAGGVLVVDFDTPLAGIDWPADPKEREILLDDDDARNFALRHIRTVAEASHLAPGAAGRGLMAERLQGLGRIIAERLPFAFWRVVEQVWRQVRAADSHAVPSLLLVSADPHIPWELASTDDDFVDPALGLVDRSRPLFLGAQWNVGRWMPPGPRTLRGTVPALPPAGQIDVRRLALVIGDYLATNGHRPLPKALEEGRVLARNYGPAAVSLGATDVDLARLAQAGHAPPAAGGGALAPDAIHFACHGEMDPANPQLNGIILSDSGDFLSPAVVRGSKLGREGAPFVFLNACQAGITSGSSIADYGGLAGAFLAEGCRGFVAPLWSVNDNHARDLALAFYQEALDSGREVGAVLRDLRARFDASRPQPPDTFLAYIFYGHPRLILNRRF